MQIKAVYRGLSCLMICSCFAVSAYGDVASDWAGDVSIAQSAAKNLTTQSSSQITESETTIPGFTDNPSEKQYYTKSPDQLNQAVVATATTDPNAKNLATQFNSGNQIPINDKTPMVQAGATIQQNADSIIKGTYPGCKQQQQCTGGSTQETCKMSRSLQLNCTNTLNVNVTYQPYPFDCNHVVTDNNIQYSELPGPDGNGNCVTGFMQVYRDVSGNLQQSGSIDATLPPGVTGHVFMTLRGLDHNQNFKPKTDQLSFQETGSGVPNMSIINPPFANPDVLWGTTTSNFTTAASPAPVKVSYNWTLIAKGKTQYTNAINGIKPAVIYISYPYTTLNIPSVDTGWVNSCGTIPAACSKTKETCTDSSSTKTINGYPVTEPCWQYSQVYQCNGPTVPSGESCAPYQDTCNAVSSSCDPAYEVNGFCLVQNITYSCPNGPCSSNLVCGMDQFCVSGDCYTPTPTQSTDFGKDDSEMAAVTGAMQSAIDNGASIAFAGQAQSCRESILDYINCCKDSGWGIDINLAKCSADEQKLGQAREQGRSVQVGGGGGSYCSHDVLGVCTEHSEGYCTFPDLMSYDVQTQGRVKQLGISFGQNSSPDCSGISVDNLQKIDFGQIDFSNVAAEIESKAVFPQTGTTQSNIEKQIQQMEGNFGGGQR